ncbi:SDR family NAD(P)-dependent oxidoreductase [Saccharopolyspora sp. ASAGF58]|uniref:SDR family NAD(P)-dependent oxidoreductase n=1 Tax=Saccharopolyspora sp. ASAGF58 TaxID=2719023 RepID=UPI00143FF3F5|nr:SDR family NAD(P)-dependent oxidoreductase [Saccharopolyspora sp. ASAGF58]QIZ38022.1 SDR family oxidoreductase [Saccharopolyspora sp. ASAGF58]
MTAPQPARDLDGQVGLVTGGAGGIGRAVCRSLVESGAAVLVADLDLDAATAVASELGGSASAMRVDVTSEGDVDAMVALVVRAHGRLDFAVNNAGIAGRQQSFVDVSLETWRRTLDVNLTSAFLCMRAELRVMLDARAGSIVNLSSAAAYRPPPGLPHYVASKNGVLGLTKSASIEFAKSGVRVNTVAPGSIDTPMLRETMGDDPRTRGAVSSRWAAGRMGEPSEVAAAVVWLCSPEASFVNGAHLIVDGGMVSL